MRIKMKRFLGILLTLTLVLGMVPGMSLTAYAADYENIEITSAVHDATSVSTLIDSLDGFCKLSFEEAKSWDPPTKSGYERLIRGYDGAYIRITIFNNGQYVNDAGITLEMAQAVTAKYYYAKKTVVAVNSVSLSPATVTLTAGGEAVAMTATVSPNNATDKKVKWSTSSPNVKLYTDTFCTTEVGTDATETLTVYAKGFSTGSATVTVTSDADSSKSAICAVTVNKADPTAPTGLNATYGQTLADVTLPDGWTWADSTQSVGNVVDPAATFKANFAGDDNHNAASNVDVTVTVGKADPTAPTSLTATYGQTLANVTLPTGWTWADSTQSVGNVVDPAATFKANFAGDDNHNAASNVDVTVTVGKANAVTATVTANGRTYDGTEKPLVTVTGEATGGEMQYALGDANGATQPYTTDIPAKTDAGTYYVWYKVIGDKNHLDTEAEPIEVKIDKAKGDTPEEANISLWSSDMACVDAVDGQEYVIVEKGGEPDWTKAVTGDEDGTVIFEGLQPYTEYDIYTRVKETENVYAGEAVSTAFLTDLAGYSVEGDTYVGETLTITTDPEDAEGLSYKWYYVNIVEEDEGYRRTELGDAIEGAEGATYTLTEDDYGKYVCVVIYKGDKEYDRSSEYGPVEYDPERISYRNTEGAGGEWTKGSSDSLQMTFKRSVIDSETFSHFTGIRVDGKAVDASDYTAEAGSVIIKLNPSFLETLTVGEHVLTVQFDDADEAEADFTVKEAAESAKDAEIKPADTQADTQKTADEKIDSPKTGDETNPQLMLLVMLLAAIDMALVAFIKSKKREN